MIEEIRISQLGVIDETSLRLGQGFNVITGETGAGKTMLVTALGLLLGARADSGAVRRAAKQARIEGVVRAGDELAAEVAEVGGVVEEGELILARQVSAEGRSRGFVGGASVPAAVLAQMADRLVAVHGQSDQHRLLRTDAQREALDAYAGTAVSSVLSDYATRYERLHRLRAELREIRENVRERSREAELLRLGLSEIERVAPQPDEDVALKAEASRLAHADDLRVTTETARSVLSADDGGDVVGLASQARRALESAAENDAEAAELATRAADLVYLASDLAADVASYASGLESDPARLAWVADRRAALTDLTRKYGDSVNEALAWAEASSRRLLELDSSESRVDEMTLEIESLDREVRDIAARLTKARTEAAGRLAEEVTAELHQLFMPQATLRIDVRERELGPTGADEVEILLAANAGLDPRALAKSASGGELSRVMLALEVVLAATRPVPTFVFDEVDAGVGGAAAVEIGRRLARLGSDAQVLVVTHLPQVAAFADHHFVVRKSRDGAVTTSGVDTLDDDGRVVELSRMLAGMEESDTARAHARELLDVARDSRVGPTRGH